MKFTNILLWTFSIIFIIGIIVLMGYIFIKYANLPPQETPNWVHWFIYRK